MKNLIIQAIAASLYATYCTSIGGKFQDGEPLPGWEEFSSDPAKAKEAQGWIDIATKAAILGAIPVDLPDEVDVDFQIKRFKWLRKRLDGILLEIKPRTDQERRLSGRESSLAVTKIQEGIMWLGMALKSIGEKTGRVDDPYPSSKDPSSSTIEPTADGLTFGEKPEESDLDEPLGDRDDSANGEECESCQ